MIAVFSGSVHDVLAMKLGWSQWSDRLGLAENEQKTVYFHRSARGRRQFEHAGIDPAQISLCPKILGCQLCIGVGRTSSEREKQRLSAATKLINKVQWLPVPWPRKKGFISSQALSRGAWGWFWRLPRNEEVTRVQSAVTKALSESVASSVNLRHLVRGHNLNFRFRITG